MKKLLIIFCVAISGFSFSQGINAAFGTGTSFVKIELGYSLSKNLHVGGYFGPGFNLIGIPSSYGAYGRYSFQESEFGGGFLNAVFRGYLGADAGLLRTKPSTSLNYKTLTYETTPGQTKLGFSVFGGGEILYGKTGKFGSFFELHLGQVPNYFSTLNSLLSESSKIASPWGLTVGLRMYF